MSLLSTQDDLFSINPFLGFELSNWKHFLQKYSSMPRSQKKKNAYLLPIASASTHFLSCSFFFFFILCALEFVDLIHSQAPSKDLYSYFLCSSSCPSPSRANPFLQYFQRTLKDRSAYHHLHPLSPQQSPPQTVSTFRMQPASNPSSRITFLCLRKEPPPDTSAEILLRLMFYNKMKIIKWFPIFIRIIILLQPHHFYF